MAHEKIPKDPNGCNLAFPWSGEWPLRSSISFLAKYTMLTKLQAICALTTQQASFTQNGHSALTHMSQPHMPQLRNINIRGRI